MTEEVKQAVEEIINTRLSRTVGAFDDFWQDVEAKLSPKHLDHGVLCWAWDLSEDHRELCIAGREAGWYTRGVRSALREQHQHYRVIVTAKDALAAIDETMKEITHVPVGGMYHQMRAAIQDLIDNAETG